MGMNGNPMGSAKVMAARVRLNSEENFLKKIDVFVPANMPIDDQTRIKRIIASGSWPAILAEAGRREGFIFAAKNGQIVAPEKIRNTLAVIRSCREKLTRYGVAVA